MRLIVRGQVGMEDPPSLYADDCPPTVLLDASSSSLQPGAIRDADSGQLDLPGIDTRSEEPVANFEIVARTVPAPLAVTTLPEILELTTDANAGVIVRTKTAIGFQTVYGPVCAPFASDAKPEARVYAVSDGNCGALFFDLESDDMCNWMKFVPLVGNGSDHNMEAFLHYNKVFFITIRMIMPREDLWVAYSESYARLMALAHASPPRPAGPKALRDATPPVDADMTVDRLAGARATGKFGDGSEFGQSGGQPCPQIESPERIFAHLDRSESASSVPAAGEAETFKETKRPGTPPVPVTNTPDHVQSEGADEYRGENNMDHEKFTNGNTEVELETTADGFRVGHEGWSDVEPSRCQSGTGERSTSAFDSGITQNRQKELIDRSKKTDPQPTLVIDSESCGENVCPQALPHYEDPVLQTKPSKRERDVGVLDTGNLPDLATGIASRRSSTPRRYSLRSSKGWAAVAGVSKNQSTRKAEANKHESSTDSDESAEDSEDDLDDSDADGHWLPGDEETSDWSMDSPAGMSEEESEAFEEVVARASVDAGADKSAAAPTSSGAFECVIPAQLPATEQLALTPLASNNEKLTKTRKKARRTTDFPSSKDVLRAVCPRAGDLITAFPRKTVEAEPERSGLGNETKTKNVTSNTVPTSRYRHAFSRLCTECDIYYQEEVFDLHQLRHTSETSSTIFKCLPCGTTDKDKTTFLLHLDAHHGRPAKALDNHQGQLCPFCGNCHRRMKDHIESKHPTERLPKGCRRRYENCQKCLEQFRHHLPRPPAQAKRRGRPSAPADFQCLICAKRCATHVERSAHIATHVNSSGLIPCPACDKPFHYYSIMQGHYALTHSAAAVKICPVCQKPSKGDLNFDTHMKSHADDYKFSCEICERKFKLAHHLKNHREFVHLKTGTQKRKQKRAEAKAKGVNEGYKGPRRRMHFEDFPYKCHDCKLGYMKRGFLVVHCQTSHSEKPVDEIPD